MLVAGPHGAVIFPEKGAGLKNSDPAVLFSLLNERKLLSMSLGIDFSCVTVVIPLCSSVCYCFSIMKLCRRASHNFPFFLTFPITWL